jgi:regulatory protein
MPDTQIMSARRPVPTEASLHEAALRYLARFAATEAGLTRVLHARIARWAAEQGEDAEATAAQASAARALVGALVARLAAVGAVSDEAFAQARSRSLARAGRSRRAIAAHLAQRGVPDAVAADALPAAVEAELAAALIHARKRRAGPFGPAPTTPESQRRVLASFARAGFSQDIAQRALRTPRDEADSLIDRFRAQL